MVYTYRIWDKASPINGCPADKAAASLSVTADKQLCILSDESGRDCITQMFPATTTAEEIKAWVDQFNADMAAREVAAAEAAKQPTLEDRVKSLEAAQLAALGV